ncbi:SNF2 domain-containing protein CLASSY 2-like isoform X2 [Prosopis cineraria]|uniref:SNF2 domain-containing protein CLASSY 2-like isoform X2 n=1 Tax=Prosopis cineraria TaxID=364024 RepID=UPI00240EA62F|nr:SNF2 domain-containing protein CLASSY 2-like isoform X2 [Prosopis cineraria]
MSHKKRNLYQSKRSLKSHPFEAFLSGSWKAVELIKIEGGTSTLHFINSQNRVLKKGPDSDIRIRSRKATLSDCSCFLRPGIDVCVLSASQQDDNSGKICLEPGWVDARIRSVQRKPHESRCSCEYFVNLYVNQGCYDLEMRSLNKESKVVGINQISILQKLDRNPCGDQHYRWESSEDCFEARKTKLFAGKFLSDFAWLVVASALKQVNFRVDNGMLVPIVAHIVLSDDKKIDQAKDASEDEISPVSCTEGLRRSKRRNIEPERYLGCDGVFKLDFGSVRTSLPKSNTSKDGVDLQANCLEEDIDACQNINKINTCQEVLVNKSGAASGKVKLDDVDKEGHKTQPVSDSLPDGGGPVAHDHSYLNTNNTGNSRHENCVFSKYNHLTHCPKLNRKIVDPWTFEPYDHLPKVPDPENSAKEIDDKSSLCYSDTRNVQRKDLYGPEDMDTENRWEGMHSNKEIQGKNYHSPMRSKSCGEERTYKDRSLSDAENCAKEIDDKSPKCYFGTCNVQMKDLSGLVDVDTENRSEGIHSDKEIQREKYQPPTTRSKSRGEERTCKDRSSSDAENCAKEIDDKSSGCYYFGACNVQRKNLSCLEDMDTENRCEGTHSDKEIQEEKYQPPTTRSKSHGGERTYKGRSASHAENSAKEIVDKSSRCYYFSASNLQRKDLSGRGYMDSENRWERHSEEIQGEKYQPPTTRSQSRGGERTYKDRSSSHAENSAKGIGDKSSSCYYFSASNLQRKNLSSGEDMDAENRWEGIQERTCKARSLSDAENCAKEVGDKSSRCYYFGTCNVHRKDLSGLEDMDTENRPDRIRSNKEIQEKKYYLPMTRSKSFTHSEERTYKDRSLSDAAYKELIDFYLKNTDMAPTKEEPPIPDQWVEFKATSNYGQKWGAKPDGEVSEIDLLWREMEVALASNYIFDNIEDSKAAVFSETEENSDKLCHHDFRLNEEIGIYCCKCGYVSTEIKDISPPFVQNLGWQQDEKQWNAAKANEDDSLHLFSNHPSTDMPVSEENDIWGLIPELTSKLHVHQKKAFEFLWKNISGYVEPASVKAASKRIGGCVISHSPGAGKTFLIIAFLASYLKLFPGEKPLVLAPKTTLYTWYKEFIKWEIPLPVYLIQSQRRAHGACKESLVIPGVPKPNGDVRHLLDSLEKIQKWHSHPSVLVMSYTYFSRLMGENSKFSHRKYMAEVLRKSPGVLILDEGHNPRSTESRLRKALMKVETELRILLSGTLFQNNFCEYFNTLFLARPKFVHEVLRELDPKYKRKKGRAERKPNFIEARARKLFLDKIAKKIDSGDSDERLQGLNMLRKITNGFIDVYEGGGSDSLPGLHVYTLLMNITDYQDQLFHALYEKIADSNRYPLEVELLVTLGAIHPWLIKTAACSDKFLNEAQLRELEKCKFDLKIGPKIRFVLGLVYRVVKEEKTLVFFHYIAPMRLFVELFEKFFGWQLGCEVLVLSGEQDLFERGRVMDKFEEPRGASKVLLASITACSEGISLTAASRVILLDSEWNPSRTRQAIARAFRPGQQRIVYVYRLLVTGTMEEEKYRKTTWKEWVSRMIFSEDFVEDQSKWQAEKLEDDILQEMIAEDKSKIFHVIMKDEKASTN